MGTGRIAGTGLVLSGLFPEAHEIGILVLSEVPFSILMGLPLLREFPSLASWVGGGLHPGGGIPGGEAGRRIRRASHFD